MKLIEITKENWLDVLFLTSNEDGMPTLCEEYVASNALSLVQAQLTIGLIGIFKPFLCYFNNGDIITKY